MPATGTAAGDGAPTGTVTAPPAPGTGAAGGPATRSRDARWERAALLAAAAVAVALPLVAALDLALPGRTVLVVLFVLTVPGVPLASLLRLPSALLATALSVALSIAVALLVATVALAAGWWSPLGWATAVAAVGLAATVLALTRAPARPAPGHPAAADDAAGREDDAEDATPARWFWRRPVALVALVAAVGLWWLATRQTDLDDAGATGVIGVVHWGYLAAVVLVAAVAAVHLVRPRLDPLVLLAAAVVLAWVIFAFVNVTDGRASVPTGWLHVGLADFIRENERSFVGLDARAHWPGFFAVAAQLTVLAGLPDATAFLALAPFAYNVLAIPALLVIARCVTRSARLAWFAVFLYLGANWVQQDYFAPQATSFLLYLAVLATLLWEATTAPAAGTGTGRPRAWRRHPAVPAGTTSGQSLGRLAALLVVTAAIVVGHQLTPITLVLAALAFALAGWTRHRRLWLFAGLLFVGWFSYAATEYWIGNLPSVIGDVGELLGNLDSAVSARVTGDENYQLMQNLRLVWSALYGLLALLGLWRIRRRPDAWLILLLLLASGGLVAMQSYGGEVMLRAFLFAAPLLAPLAALALSALTARRAVVPVVALTVGLAVWGVLGTAARGVNVSFERVTDDDVAAARVLWAELDRGDTVAFLASAGAYGADRFGDYEPLVLDQDFCDLPARECVTVEQPDFVVVSRTQDAQRELAAGDPPGAGSALADELVATGEYRVLYESAGSRVLERTTQGG
jgi:hypothetical protein